MALEQLPQLTSQKSLVERIKYQISVGAPFIILKGCLGAGKTVICEQLISSVDDKFIKAYIPGAGNHDLTKCREILLNQLTTKKINANDKLIGTVQKMNFEKKRVLIVIDDFDSVADRFISELVDIYSTYKNEQLFSIVATVSSSSKLSQKVRQLNSLAVEPMEMQIKPISMQESILVMHYYGSQVGMRGLDDRSLKNSRELQAAKGNPGAIKSMIEGLSDSDCSKYNPIDRARRRKKATIIALAGGATVAAIVAGALVYVIKHQNKPLVESDYVYQQTDDVMKLIDEDEKNVDSLTPELSKPRSDLSPLVTIDDGAKENQQTNGQADEHGRDVSGKSADKKIVISDEDSADVVAEKGNKVDGKDTDKLKAEADIEAKAKDIAEEAVKKEKEIKQAAEKTEAEAKAKLEAEKKAVAEKAAAEAKAKLEAEKKAAEEKAAAEAKAKLEAEKKAAEEKAAAEAKAKLEAEKKAAEEKAAAEAKAKLEAEKKAAAEKAAAEAKAKLEAEKKAAAEKAAAEAKAKLEAEKKAAAEKAAAEAKAKLEAEKKAAAEKAAAEAKAKLEAEKKAAAEKAAAEAKAKLEAEKKAAAEKAAAEAKAKLEAEKKAAAEKAAAEAKAKLEAEKKAAAERAVAEAAGQGKLLENKKLSFEELNDSHYTVQVVATSHKEEAQRVAQKVGNSWVLFRQKDQQYIVMYGDFKDRSAATKSISGLPESIRKTKPWAKSVGAVKKEIQ